MKSKYHPVDNPKALPAVTSIESLDQLPWGGNHWWDWPIMQHVEAAAKDDAQTAKEESA